MSESQKVVPLVKTFPTADLPPLPECDIAGMPDRLALVTDVLGLTDREMAKQSGVTERVINTWKDSAPSQFERLLRICSTYKIDPLWLLTGATMDQVVSGGSLSKYTSEELDLACHVLRDALAASQAR